MFGTIPDDHLDSLFPTTTQEACREQAREIGRDRPDSAWISTSWDTWEPNPYYQGAPVPHPEDDAYCEQCYAGQGDIEEIEGVTREPSPDDDDIPW